MNIRQNALVKFDFSMIHDMDYHEYPFGPEDRFVYIGDIVQMPGHCIVVRMSDGQNFAGYHTDDFIELTEEEV